VRRRGLALAVVLVLVLGACGDDDADGAEATASAAAALTDARIGALVSTMEVMAMSAEVRSGEWDDMVGTLTAFQESAIPLVAWFVLPDGSYFTVTAGLTTANLSDRSYFPGVMAGETVIGTLVVSRSTGRKSMVAVVPVADDGEVIGALGISVFLTELSDLTASDLMLGPDAVFYAVDGDGTVALHTDEALITEPASALPEDPGLATATSTLLGWVFSAG